MEYSIILEPASGVNLTVNVESKNFRQDEFFRLGLLFDKIYIISMGVKQPLLKYNEKKPFAQIIETNVLDGRAQRDIKRFFLNEFTAEIVTDYRKVYKEYKKGDDLAGGQGVILLRSTIYRAFQNHWYFYILPGFRDSFLDFILKYQPKYIETVKESLLICELLKLIFQTFIPAFDPNKVNEKMSFFAPFKKDFQFGFFKLIEELKGSYFLSPENSKFIKERINIDEKKLLLYLSPEKLKKMNVKTSTIKFLSGLLLDQIPLLEFGQEVFEFYNDIKKIKEFETENLYFVLSIIILKKYFVSAESKTSVTCGVCNITYEEIKKLSEKEAHDLIFSRNRCERHMIAYLDLRKMYQLIGKSLLLAMKDFKRFSFEIEEK